MNSTTTNLKHDYEGDYIEKVEWLENYRKAKIALPDSNSNIVAYNTGCIEQFHEAIPRFLFLKEIEKECKQNGVNIYYKEKANTDENIEGVKHTRDYNNCLNYEILKSSYDPSYNGNNQSSTGLRSFDRGSDDFRIVDNKLVLENSTGKYYFSLHTIKHSGDFEILYCTATIGKNNCCVITEERKNLGDDLRQSGIKVYSLWHSLPIMVKDYLITKETMFKIANNLPWFTNQTVCGELLNKALIKTNRKKII